MPPNPGDLDFGGPKGTRTPDLLNAIPNVYLELGFAWGRAKLTLLLVRDTKHLKFDVQVNAV